MSLGRGSHGINTISDGVGIGHQLVPAVPIRFTACISPGNPSSVAEPESPVTSTVKLYEDRRISGSAPSHDAVSRRVCWWLRLRRHERVDQIVRVGHVVRLTRRS